MFEDCPHCLEKALRSVLRAPRKQEEGEPGPPVPKRTLKESADPLASAFTFGKQSLLKAFEQMANPSL